MNLSDKKSVKSVLSNENFSFKKSLGQNFIIDPDVCPRMAAATACDNCGIIEIGPGAGVLTRELSSVAKKVVAIEIDERLRPVLDKTLSGLDNVSVIFADVLKTDLKKLIKEEFAGIAHINICANLPYYITSPIIMELLQAKLPIENITVMVQKEAAERICAEVGSRPAGAVTVAVKYYADAEILFDVPKESFLPPPKVDSSVIRLKVLKTPPVNVLNEEFFFKIVKACFAQRRKTLLNTVSNTVGTDKSLLRDIIGEMSLAESVRGETLSLNMLADLSNRLYRAQQSQ